jgi:uncharacterized membrane protein YfcA
MDLFSDYSLLTILAFILFAFIAGFIDSVVGGGGLIQLPALLIGLPGSPIPVIFGTNKIAALSGTSVAAFQYSRRIKFNFRLLLIIAFFSFVASYLGAKSLNFIDARTLKPLILIILILIAVYTFIKKDLGSVQTKLLPLNKQMFYGSLIGFIVGFYDGFFGPGTGSFFILGFVMILGFEFVTASAYAKVINCVTNLSALIVFIRHGQYILELALLMAVCNVAGSLIGSRMAIKKGNAFVRIFFLIIVVLMILKYGYDIFFP